MCLLRVEFLVLYHKLNGKLAHPTFDIAFSESSNAMDSEFLNLMLTHLGTLELNVLFRAVLLKRIHVRGAS